MKDRANFSDKLVDAVTASLEIAPEVKYGFLEESNVKQRIDKLRPLLKGMRISSQVWKKHKK